MTNFVKTSIVLCTRLKVPIVATVFAFDFVFVNDLGGVFRDHTFDTSIVGCIFHVGGRSVFGRGGTGFHDELGEDTSIVFESVPSFVGGKNSSIEIQLRKRPVSIPSFVPFLSSLKLEKLFEGPNSEGEVGFGR